MAIGYSLWWLKFSLIFDSFRTDLNNCRILLGTYIYTYNSYIYMYINKQICTVYRTDQRKQSSLLPPESH